jgi:hypothetical protein
MQARSNRKKTSAWLLKDSEQEYNLMVAYYRKHNLCFYCSGKGKVDYDWAIRMCPECYGTGKSK